MKRNVEIKARVDDPEALRARVAAVATAGPSTRTQEDHFFAGRSGRLKLRLQPDRPAELIYYERPDGPGPEPSSYLKISCPEPQALRELLERSLGTRGVVRKRRTLYRVGRTRVHLDAVEGLGDFVELEVELGPRESVDQGRREAERLMARLGIEPNALEPRAYIDLLAAGA